MDEKEYTISILTEDRVGMIGKLVTVFTRRRTNIKSLTVAKTESTGVARFTIVAPMTDDAARKTAAQLRKIVEVVGVTAYTEPETVQREIAFARVPADTNDKAHTVWEVIMRYDARIVYADRHSIVLEKTGVEDEITLFYEKLQPFGLLDFVRSGRIAISKERSKGQQA